jgi:hypothetical protein
MNPKLLLAASLAAFLAVALPAAAEYDPDKPPCPEDMFCTLDAPADDGNATAAGPPGDGMCRHDGSLDDKCAGETRPTEDCVDGCPRGSGDNMSYGCATESCAADSGPVDGGSTCMDGQQGNETCRDDVQYLGGQGAPTDGSGAPVEAAQQDGRTVPGVATIALVGGLLGVALLVSRRR